MCRDTISPLQSLTSRNKHTHTWRKVYNEFLFVYNFVVDSGSYLSFLKDQVTTSLILLLDSSVISLVKYSYQTLSRNWVQSHSTSVTALLLLLHRMLEGHVPCLVFDTSHLICLKSGNHERCFYTWQAWSLWWLEAHMLQFPFTGDFAKQLAMGELLAGVRYGWICFQSFFIFSSNWLTIVLLIWWLQNFTFLQTVEEKIARHDSNQTVTTRCYFYFLRYLLLW